ncbi:MAG: DUF3667 domain-containing protein [Sphingobacteriaceae bacterium]|nr:MAG: DUF3667 domain-containing protein [Sphingobacteriaceae bacterium]
MKKHYREENDCLNCGAELAGKYCHKCGQENLHLKENFGHVITHAVADYFHFDHHFFHTLKPLLFEPGKLTNEYMAGRRAQFLHPVKMYIFISIVYFLLAFSNGHEVVKETTVKTNDTAEKVINKDGKIHFSNDEEYSQYLKEKENETIKQAIKSTFKPTKYTPVDPEVADNGFENAFLKIFTDRAGQIDYDTYPDYLKAQEKLPAKQQDSFWDRYIIKKYITWQHDGVNSKKLFIDGVKHNIPKMMFILLPLYALILKISFWKNRKFYVEHLIFSFHFHCFIFLFFTIMILLKMVIPESWGVIGWLEFAEFIVIILYTYRAFRTVYHRTRFRTITKMIGISFMYLMTFCYSITLVAFITALTSV